MIEFELTGKLDAVRTPVLPSHARRRRPAATMEVQQAPGVRAVSAEAPVGPRCERCGRDLERTTPTVTGVLAVYVWWCPAQRWRRTGLAGPLRAWLNRRHTTRVIALPVTWLG